jgi:hypothetical protein
MLITPILSPDPVPRCPRCRKPYHAAYVQRGHVFPECQKCGQRWWAMLLRPGPVLPQLARDFEDDGIAQTLVATYGLPESLTVRCFWQFPMTPLGVHENRDGTPTSLFRAMALLPMSKPDPAA